LGTDIRLIEESLSDLLQRLREHTIDIAVLPEADYASAFRSASVFEEPLFYVPRSSIKAKTAPAELKELGSDTFVMRTLRPPGSPQPPQPRGVADHFY
jgi:DNA-binding transcriptional LysR family regulator